MAVPDEKQLRVIEKILTFTRKAPNKVKRHEVASVQGTIQHLTFVCRAGHLFLPPLSAFLANFPNDYVSHHVPCCVLTSLSWWLNLLRHPPIRRSLSLLPLLDKDIWVDASSSWGIALVVNHRWAAWRLVSGWMSDGRDIGWVEAVALEMATIWLSETDHHDARVVVRCDNVSVIDAFHKGRSQNTHRNACLMRISSILALANLVLIPMYVSSDFNKADPISRGKANYDQSRLLPPIQVPCVLSPFLVSF